ncbi:MAG: hypothetical protein Q4C04_05705 [Clostridia bacterium]|nr:hypothetical protein [Clostridia bacterium]
MKKLRRKKRFIFKPIHFILLLAIDLCVLAGVLIPQRNSLLDAQQQLEERQEYLTQVQMQYAREQDNLEFMRTNRYKLQQGSIKYGWHFEEDTLIADEATPTPSSTPLAIPSSSPSPSA